MYYHFDSTLVYGGIVNVYNHLKVYSIIAYSSVFMVAL